MSLAIVIPTYQDDEYLDGLLDDLCGDLASQTVPMDVGVCVADGGFSAATRQLVERYGYQYLAAPRGRGSQIAAGMSACRADWFWILHADSRLNPAAWSAIWEIVADGLPRWGRFNVVVEGLPWLSCAMNLRSRLTKMCTGDQGMFVHANLIAAIDGFPAQPLMEDIELSKRLRRAAGRQFIPVSATIQTSSRRWRDRGVLRTVLHMWRYRWRYWRGADPRQLFNEYYGS